MITVCCWFWGDKYSPDYVNKLGDGVRRHLKQPHRFVCFSPDNELTRLPGCFARLQMFDPQWQAENGIDDRLVCIDIDTVITGPLDPLFDRPEQFVILQGINVTNPCRFSGALMMLRPGAHPEVWSDFTYAKARGMKFRFLPDDQGWIYNKLGSAPGWKPRDGVYGFHKPGWGMTDDLPHGARLVTFAAKDDPAHWDHLQWVKDNW